MPAKIFTTLLLLAGLILAGCENNSPPAAPASAPSQEATPDALSPASGETAETEASAPEAGLPEEAEAAPPAEGPVAVVNGVTIDRRMFESQVVMAEAGRNTFGGPEEEAVEAARQQLQLRLEVLDSLISLELACQEAIERGYAPGEEEVKAALEALNNDYEGQGGLYKVLDQYGSSEEEMRAQLIKTMALKKWQENDFLAQIRVSDEEARNFYDQNQQLMSHGDLVRASQIFIAVPLLSSEKGKEAAKAKAEAALKRLAAGEDFGTVAVELSDYPGAKSDRGDMGWTEKGQSMPAFDQAVFNRLKPGQHSDIQESPMGFHIFKVTEIKAAGVEPFDEAKGDIREFLSGVKLEQALGKKMDELLKKADIEILDPELKKLYQAARAARISGDGQDSPSVEKKLVRPPQGAAD